MNESPQIKHEADAENTLQAAYESALAFMPDRADTLKIVPAQAHDFAKKDADLQTIVIDDCGMSTGMKRYAFQPLESLAGEWRGLWNNFEIAIQPKMADINAVQKLRSEAESERKKCSDTLKTLEMELEKDPKYDQIKDHYNRSKDLFNGFRDKHGNRNAIMFANNLFYLFLLFLIILTEGFINYRAFMIFWGGVPAVAFGTTAMLGVLLALASHWHGEILKQWSYRFGADRKPEMRWSDWRMFSLSTLALVIVIAFAGWARWSVAIDDMAGSASQASALGDIGTVQVDPLRDVLVSLIANLGAWMVGVMISYLAHDSDPDYMAATKQYRIAHNAWNRARARHTAREKQVEAAARVAIEEKTRAAETRQRSVTHEMDMRSQILSRGEAVKYELSKVAVLNAETYRNALVRIALKSHDKVLLVRSDKNSPLSPYDYNEMKLIIPEISTLKET